MKKMMRFAAMAATMIALCVSCEEIKNEGLEDDKNNNENVDGGGSEGEGGNEEDVTPVSIDGKQYVFSFKYGGMYDATGVLDLGVTTEGFAMILMNLPAMTGEDYMPISMGNYEITATDATSGTISIVDPSDPSASEFVISYSSAAESSVSLSCTTEVMTLDNVSATVPAENIIINLGE